jgi:imidazolonepropionase-like amidohydrolase
MATLGSARVLGRDAELGSVEIGKLADMVLIDGNPLTDVNDLMNVVVTIKGGRIVSDSRKK